MAAVGACDLCREDQAYLKCCRGVLLQGPAGPEAYDPDGDEDRISALPDDMLLQVLARLCCARAAAHTGLLAHRWRSLWARLQELVFHCTGPDLLDAALARVARPATSLLDIDVSNHHKLEPARIALLLRAAAALAPVELVVHINASYPRKAVVLPCFDRTTSTKLEVRNVRFTLPPAGEFTALESLHLEECLIDLTDLLPRCPCLRKLSLMNWNSEVTVNSPSLEELVVYAMVRIRQIDIFGPALKRVYVDAHRGISKDFSFSYSAPAVEDLTWKRECHAVSVRFGATWRLWTMTIGAHLLPFEHMQLDNANENTCFMLQGRTLTRALSLWMETDVFSGDASKSFEREISQFLVTNFSVLELDLTPRGHVYGAMILHLLGFCTSIQMLTVTLDLHVMRRACHADCVCDQPSNWRSQVIPLTGLKEVQIRGFEGKGHEVDFLKVLLRCAPMLERVTLRFSGAFSPSDSECIEILNIFEAYPSVECKMYRMHERMFYRYGSGYSCFI